MKSWKSAVNGVVAATARSTCASPSTSRRVRMPASRRSSSVVGPLGSSVVASAASRWPSSAPVTCSGCSRLARCAAGAHGEQLGAGDARRRSPAGAPAAARRSSAPETTSVGRGDPAEVVAQVQRRDDLAAGGVALVVGAGDHRLQPGDQVAGARPRTPASASGRRRRARAAPVPPGPDGRRAVAERPGSGFAEVHSTRQPVAPAPGSRAASRRPSCRPSESPTTCARCGADLVEQRHDVVDQVVERVRRRRAPATPRARGCRR